MNSGATLPALQARADHALPWPVVFVDGVPDARLAVVSYIADAPLDVRTITLNAASAVVRPALRRHWQHARAIVAQPMRLVDDQVRWVVLGEGVIGDDERTSAEERERRQLTLHDAWAVRLSRRLEQLWWVRADDVLVAQPTGRMQPGSPGNRSGHTFRFAGRDVHVLEQTGEPWRLADALATLSAWAQLDLSLALLPAEVADAPLTQTVDLTAPVGEALTRLLEPYDLVVQREAVLESDTVIERRAVRPAMHGRVVQPASPRDDQPVGHLVSLDRDAPAPAAQPWIARADGWRVESTFDLVPGWHPDSEGAADADYDRTASDDFARYANAYRYWVLNEDGRFSVPPYERGPAFDLATFFGEGDLRPQALPLRPCLTLDDAGEPRPPVVEVSTDAGQTWAQYPGQVRLAEHRAAVYLDDDALPVAFLTAAQAGDARLRVTASLQSPRPVEVVRWRGNPFAGTRPPRVFDLGATFRFERVASSSIHHPQVETGELEARQSAPHVALRQWLAERLREPARSASADAGRSRLTLAGTWLTVRPGDRMAGEGETVESTGAAARPNAVVQRIRCRLDRAVTELDLRL
ncbi:MAG: hypothetical protein WD534_04860 [Phycisphaeraceae bacterium]